MWERLCEREFVEESVGERELERVWEREKVWEIEWENESVGGRGRESVGKHGTRVRETVGERERGRALERESVGEREYGRAWERESV